MTPTLLRFAHLKARNIVNNWVTLRRWQDDPDIAFPLGRMTGPHTRVWTEQEINQWLDSRPVRRAREAEAAEAEAAAAAKVQAGEDEAAEAAEAGAA